MANAKKDENHVSTMIGQDSTDGVTVTLITANPSSHALSVDNNTTGSDLSQAPAKHDENHVPTLMAVSESDGVTPIPLYVTPAGLLLIDST